MRDDTGLSGEKLFMKHRAKYRQTAHIVPRGGIFGTWLSKMMAVLIIAVLLCGNAGVGFAVELSAESVQDSSNDSTGQDVTIHFGDDEDRKIRIHINDGEEYSSEDETEAEVVAEPEFEEPRKEYVYEDSKVRVTATLETPGAVPAEAEFRVTEVTPDSDAYNYDAYMEALNDSAQTLADELHPETGGQQGMKVTGLSYDESNTLLYDVAFIMQSYDEEGNIIEGGEYEYQPDEGSVDIRIEFKKGQLTDSLGISDEQDVTINHLPLSDEVKENNDTTANAMDISTDDISVEPIAADSVTLKDGGMDQADFQMESFSVIAVSGHGQKTLEAVPYESISAESVLGSSIYYGVTANDWYFIEKDSETSMAIGTWHGTGGQNGSNDSKSMGAQCQYIMVGKVEGQLCLKGYKAYLYSPYTADSTEIAFEGTATSEQRLNHIVYIYKSEQDVKDEVRAMIDAAQSMSDNLASKDSLSESDYESLPAYDSAQKYVIDLTGLPDGTYYINTQKWPNLVSSFTNNGAVTIKKKSGQRIVFNFPENREYKINKYLIVNDGITYDSVSMANTTTATSDVIESVVFNFPNASKVGMEDIAGIILAPKAQVDTYGVGGGWVVCNDFHNYCEWHLTYHKVYEETSQAVLQARKKIDNEYATVAGFTFKLEKQKADNSWEEVQSVRTDAGSPSAVSFTPIEYSSQTTQDAGSFPHDYIYKITEPGETTVIDGKTYYNDTSVYYAKVTVTKRTEGNVTKYLASHPFYYSDAECTVSLGGEPAFNNTSQTFDLKVKKAWKDHYGSALTDNYPADSISFDLYRVTRTDGQFTEAPTEGGTKAGSYTIRKGGEDASSSEDDWTLVIRDLPSMVRENGVTKYYGYYVVENPMIQDYTAAYKNNSLTTHEITITNTQEERTSITVDKKWFRGDDEVNAPVSAINFDLYRLESGTNPNSQSLVSSGSSGTGSSDEDGLISDYTINVKWGYYNAYQLKARYNVHAGDTIHIVATSLSQASLNASFSYPYESAGRTVQGTVIGSIQETVYVNEYYSYQRTIVTTEFDYIVPSIETLYKDWDGAPYNMGECYLNLVFQNNPDEVTDVSVSKASAASQENQADSAAPAGMTHDTAASQDGSSVWDDVNHSYTLSASDGWSRTINSLPVKGTNAAGETVYYTYYVVEQNGSGYDAASAMYANNAGIASGAITIKNQVPDEEYTYTDISVTKQWLGNGDADITASKSGSISFVIKRKLYIGAGEAPESSNSSEPYPGGELESAEGVAYSAENHVYTITAFEDQSDASGSARYVWPTAHITKLPQEVRSVDGSTTYTCKYYVEEVNTNGVIDATYRVGKGNAMGTCTPVNDGSTVTIINREMSYSIPATGGEGTRRIYLISSLLIVLAGAGFVMLRRRSWMSES